MKKEYIKPFAEFVSFEADETLLADLGGETSGSLGEGGLMPDDWE